LELKNLIIVRIVLNSVVSNYKKIVESPSINIGTYTVLIYNLVEDSFIILNVLNTSKLSNIIIFLFKFTDFSSIVAYFRF